jgi:hypothetical protein
MWFVKQINEFTIFKNIFVKNICVKTKTAKKMRLKYAYIHANTCFLPTKFEVHPEVFRSRYYFFSCSLSLFFAAQCDKYETSLGTDANRFVVLASPGGESLTVGCNLTEGYFPATATTSSTVTCIEGKWSVRDVTCNCECNRRSSIILY